MLTWALREVDTPYGAVATRHWAVPDSVCNNHGGSGGNAAGENTTAMHVELESAEDQLGAVLWNSNSAALRHLHTRVFHLPLSPSLVAPSSTDPSVASLAERNIVELGAGVGCLGIALAMAGARVAITDLKELVPLMEHNVQLNVKRVLERSHGHGYCIAMSWKWGPTASTSVHKQLQKEKVVVKGLGPKQQQQQASPVTVSQSHLSAVAHRVVTSMAADLLKPSASLIECATALQRTRPASGAEPAAAVGSQPFHYVVLCDALYGNPKDWPALLYTLTELMATNPDECVVVNFCEQRVNDVEGAFLKVLDAENAKIFVPPEERERQGDALWTIVTERALRCCAAGATTPPSLLEEGGETHQLREEAASALLHYVLVQRRGWYRWVYSTEVVQDAQSELGMVIHVTSIRWMRVDAATATANHGDHCSTERQHGGAQQRRTADAAVTHDVTRSLRRPRGTDEAAEAPTSDAAPHLHTKRPRHNRR